MLLVTYPNLLHPYKTVKIHNYLVNFQISLRLTDRKIIHKKWMASSIKIIYSMNSLNFFFESDRTMCTQ